MVHIVAILAVMPNLKMKIFNQRQYYYLIIDNLTYMASKLA